MVTKTGVSGFDLILPFFPREVQDLIMDPAISDLMFVGERVFIDRVGRLTEVEGVNVSAKALRNAIESIAQQLGGDINSESPILNSRLPNGARVAAVASPCSPLGTTVTIRKFARHFHSSELVEMGSIPAGVLETVLGAILNRKNLIVSGGTSSGKTTVLNAIIEQVPAAERLIVIENPIELMIFHDNAVRWEFVDAVGGRPGFSASQLVSAALRHRPDRIILGEVRDASAYDLLQAMNTGHGGSMSTVHASGADRALVRISNLALSAHSNLDQRMVREETAEAINYVLHVQRYHDGKRRVQELIKVNGFEGDSFDVESLYTYKGDE